jgi:hypothetical protein
VETLSSMPMSVRSPCNLLLVRVCTSLILRLLVYMTSSIYTCLYAALHGVCYAITRTAAVAAASKKLMLHSAAAAVAAATVCVSSTVHKTTTSSKTYAISAALASH